jgi:hypothetical protein
VAGLKRATGGTRGAKWAKTYPYVACSWGQQDLVKTGSKEVGELGSKRTSSGCNGVHHVWWSGLIFRLLEVLFVPAMRRPPALAPSFKL